MLQEIGIGHQAQPEARQRLAADRNRVGHAVQMGALGRIGGQLSEMTADGVQLPQKSFMGGGGLVPGEQSIDEPRDQVRPQREARRGVVLELMLRARTLQEWGVRQDAYRRLGLTEELLRREQVASFR